MDLEERDRWEDEISNGFKSLDLPLYMYDGVKSWVFSGLTQGSFLDAVLRNDLARAAITADSANSLRLCSWGRFCYCHLPAKCWGSDNNVDNWKGLDYV